MSCFRGLPTRTFEMQEVESLTARSRKKLKISPQEAARTCEEVAAGQTVCSFIFTGCMCVVYNLWQWSPLGLKIEFQSKNFCSLYRYQACQCFHNSIWCGETW